MLKNTNATIHSHHATKERTMTRTIETQICKTRDGWVVNIKADGLAVAVYGYFRKAADAYAVAGDMANAARAGQVVRGSIAL